LDRVGKRGREEEDDDDMLKMAKYEYSDDVGAVGGRRRQERGDWVYERNLAGGTNRDGG
jgi:hypothetical protein